MFREREVGALPGVPMTIVWIVGFLASLWWLMSSAQWGHRTSPSDRAALSISACPGVARTRMSTPRTPSSPPTMNPLPGLPPFRAQIVIPAYPEKSAPMKATTTTRS